MKAVMDGAGVEAGAAMCWPSHQLQLQQPLTEVLPVALRVWQARYQAGLHT